MAESDVKIVVEMKDYIDLHGGDYDSWYVGRAEHPEEKLVYHGVDLQQDRYIYRSATCVADARSVELYFVKRLGTDGEISKNGDKAVSVYAYKKHKSTRP